MNNISLVFTTNFVNHYSLALALELKKYFNDFYFVVKEALPEDRKKLGFEELDNYDFIIKEYENPNKVKELFDNSDVVVTDFTYNKYISNRLKENKITIVDSERLFKESDYVKNALRRIFYKYHYRNYKNAYLLCISAYAAGDYNKLGLFVDRTYKWGYFSSANTYDIDKLIQNKKKNSIVWSGRLIDWKHPDDAIMLASMLKKDGYDFELNIIGNGEMEKQLSQMIDYLDVKDCVYLLGSMSPNEVRKHMEESEIYLFTSDKGEGWGVVLNEAMNSGCACVASYSAGSTPFLIKNNINGLIYKNDELFELYSKTKMLLDNDGMKKEYGKKAYETIIEEYNPSNAAYKFYKFVEALKSGESVDGLFDTDILSKANRL